MADLDQDFVEYIVKAIVENPDKVVVEKKIDERGVLIELTVDPADMGQIIGKEGRTAKSIRTLLRVLGAKSDSRINMKVVEPEGGTGGAPHHDEAAHVAEEADGAMVENSEASASFAEDSPVADEVAPVAEVVPAVEEPEVIEESEATINARAAAKEATDAADLEI